MKLEDLRREDWIIGGVALVLIIGLLAFPWFEVSIGPFTASATATGAPDGWAGILALIVAIALLGDLAVERFLPDIKLPELGGSREATRFFLAVGVDVFVALKFLFEIQFSDFGWGFYLDVILAAALVFFTIQARRVAAPAIAAGPTTTTTIE